MAQQLPSLLSLGLLDVTLEQIAVATYTSLTRPIASSTLSVFDSSSSEHILGPPATFEAAAFLSLRRPVRSQTWQYESSCTMSRSSFGSAASRSSVTLSPRSVQMTSAGALATLSPRALISSPKDMSYYRDLDSRIAAGKRHGRQRAAYKRRQTRGIAA